MPRPPRIHVPNAFYHVTLRGNHRNDIFFTDADRRYFIERVTRTMQQFGARLHAYCLMTNHVHMLIQIADDPLGRLILRIAAPYARYVQRNMGTTGHLFEKRYYSGFIDSDEYLLAVLRYIHLNPVEAGIVKNVSDYNWSSHRTYLGLRQEPWVTTDFVLRIFHEECERAVISYKELMEGWEPRPNGASSCESRPADTRVMGDDLFGPESSRHRSRGTLGGIVDEASAKFGLPANLLRSDCRRRDVVRARAWIAHRAVSLRVASMSEVARHLGCTEGALRQTVKRHFGNLGK